MNLFYRLNKGLVRESAAIEELHRFAGFSARLHSVDGRYVVLIPAGRRPETVLKRLAQFCAYAPESFDLVAYSDEGVVSALPVVDATARNAEA